MLRTSRGQAAMDWTRGQLPGAPVLRGVLAHVRRSFRRASEGAVLAGGVSKVGAAWVGLGFPPWAASHLFSRKKIKNNVLSWIGTFFHDIYINLAKPSGSKGNFMESRNQNPFSGPVTVFQDRRLPEEAVPVGYAALVGAHGLNVPLPRTLSAIGPRHRLYQADGWAI